MIKKLIVLAALIISTNAGAAVSEPDRATMAPRNALINPGAENGKVGWTASGSFTASTSTPLVGNASFVWDASASSQRISSNVITVPEWLKGQNGVVSCQIRCASGTCTHSLQAYDGTNVLATGTISSSTSGSPRTSVNFIGPTSGNISLSILSNADEPSIKIDGCIIARADEWNLSQVSQASLYGSAFYAATASCDWVNTGTSYSTPPADASCPAPTLGGFATAPATKIPGLTFNSLPSGSYLVVARFLQSGSGGPTSAGYRFSDGTTSSGEVEHTLTSTSVAHTLVGNFSYSTAQSALTFVIQSKRAGGTNIWVDATASPLEIVVYRFPSSAETAARVDTVANSWSGFHDSTCSFARTNTAYGDPAADATCTFTERKNRNFGTVTSYLSGSDKLPGIVFTPVRAGFYWICARFGSLNGSTGALGYRLTDGTTVIFELNDSSQTTYKSQMGCGIYDAASVASKTLRLESKASASSATISTEAGAPAVEWSIFSLDQSFPAPLLVGSVISDSTGAERIVRARLSGACALTSGTGISGVTGSAANCVSTFSPAFSATPTCMCHPDATLGGGSILCNTTAVSASSVTTMVHVAASTSGSSDPATLICVGPR